VNRPTPEPRQGAVVAWYGREPTELRRLRDHVHGLLSDALGSAFVPRAVGTLHSTIIGLDGLAPFPPGPVQDALAERTTGADLGGLLLELRSVVHSSPPVIQFGGFGDGEHPVTSRGQRLADRTLVVDGRKVVLVGWPVVEGSATWQLDELRRRCARRGFAHRYPLDDTATDPDAHMVVGEIAGVADRARILDEVVRIRGSLASTPLLLAMAAEEISVVTYTDPRLPFSTTEAAPLVSLTRV
jgi:hypothetical protein